MASCRQRPMKRLSRREFVRLSAAGAVASPFVLDPAVVGAAAPTSQEVVDRIRKNVGAPWKADTVDTFKAGDPSTVVTGIVTPRWPPSTCCAAPYRPVRT